MTLVQQQWCVGGLALRLEREPMTLMDEASAQDFLLLSLKSTGDLEWLNKYLEKPSRWWKSHGREQPLIQEFLEAITPGKYPPNTVMPIVLRGKEILCRYMRASPTLAFFADKPDFESLEWFLRELEKDLVNEGRTKRRRKTQETKESEEQQIIDEILENIRDHENCSKAWFLDSRSSIKVLSCDQRLKEFIVKAIKKKRAQALIQQDRESWEHLRSAFLEVVVEARIFLEEKAPGESSSAGPHEEPRVPPVEPKAEADDESLEQ